jgi:NADH-quinone oxidoreductase subunit J
MVLVPFVFYLFESVLVLSALGVIAARNPVHSVLLLILAFFNAAGLFVLLGAEFIAMILVIVYVGAVAVLFLFVVMMLDISFANLRAGAMRAVPLGLVLGGVLLFELIALYQGVQGGMMAAPVAETARNVNNTEALGGVLYTKYILPFQASGIILLISMIGAIVLTHRIRPGVRRQSVAEQVATRARDVMSVTKPESGAGVSDV